MYDSPSADLLAKIAQYTPCRERDVLACRRSIRTLSRELPLFESTWLDALVRARKLTPFQAEILSEGHGDQLVVGEYWLIDVSLNERSHQRYLGMHRNSRQLVTIDAFPENQIPAHEVAERLRSKPNRRPSSERIEYLSRQGQLFVVVPYQQGVTLQELLVRHGRLNPSLLKDVTHCLCQILSRYQSTGVVHGDIRLGNTLLLPNGELYLFNQGVIPELQPVWSLHETLPHETYDHFAPEIVHTGQRNHATDLYAAGCLLWQCACGRPPHYSVDPLIKLNSHVEEQIPPVQEIAPETDEGTIKRIETLTSEDPAARLQAIPAKQRRSHAASISAAAVQFRPARLDGLRTRREQWKDRAVIAAVMLTCMAGAGLAVNTAIPSVKAAFTWISTPAKSDPQQSPTTPTQTTPESQFAELPEVTSDGLLELSPGVKYQATNITAVGPVHIRLKQQEESSVQEPAQIIVNDSPWRIWGTTVSVSDVVVTGTPTSLKESRGRQAWKFPPALVVCQSMGLTTERCRFVLQTKTKKMAESTQNQTRGIAWKPIAEMEPHQGRLQFQNCHFDGLQTGLLVAGEARELDFYNCLGTSTRELIQIDAAAARGKWPKVRWEQVTMRDALSGIHLNWASAKLAKRVRMDVEATNCVVSFQKGVATSFVKMTTSVDPSREIEAINLLGQMVLVDQMQSLVAWQSPGRNQLSLLTPEGQVEGVLTHAVRFAGQPSDNPSDSELSGYQGPRWNSIVPGIEVARWREVAEPIFR